MHSLSCNGLGAEGAAALAPALAANVSLTSLNLSSNNLCSVTETGYIKASQVQGSSFNEGDKVVYQGKEMIVSKAKDGDGDIKMTGNRWIRMTNLPDMTGLNALADAFHVNGSLTVTNLLGNQLDAESAKMLAEVAKRKGISLCGIQRDQTTADFSNQNLEPRDAILLALDLSQAGVTGSLTELFIYGNRVGDEGVRAICEAIQSNKETKLASLNFGNNGIGPVGANALAAMVAVTGSLTKLLLDQNELEKEGTKAICEALEQNTTLKELDIRGGCGVSNIGGPAGVKLVAKMLGVNGGLTSIDLSGNQLCGVWTELGEQHGTYTAEGITAIAEALRVNGSLTSIDLSDNALTNYGRDMTGIKQLAAALGVNGALTSINLSNNVLCGTNRYGGGTYTAEGIIAIADALRVNGSLTVTNLLKNELDAESAKMLAEVAKQKGISLCGIQRDQTTADVSNIYLEPPDAILLASDLSQAGVTGLLTSIDLSGNALTDYGRDMTGIMELAAALGVNGSLTKMRYVTPKLERIWV